MQGPAPAEAFAVRTQSCAWFSVDIFSACKSGDWAKVHCRTEQKMKMNPGKVL